MNMNVAVTRPIVRYHGGKWKLAPWIISHFPPHRVYVEPFGGGASVLLRKERSYAEVYNDLDGEIVNLFRVARDYGEELKQALELTPFAREEFKLAYEKTEDCIEQARRTVVKSFMGFGSGSINAPLPSYTGFRKNTRGDSVPARAWRELPAAVSLVVERLQGVVIENKAAVEVMISHDSKETLHYVDPPYVADTRGRIRGYKHELNDDDHIALAEVLKEMQGNVVLSGYRCELYDHLYSTWIRHDRVALADGARKKVESIWIKNVHKSLFD